MNRKGQNISEYGIVLALVMLALYSMNAYFKRGIQGVVKASADEMGRCAEAEYQNLRGESTNYRLLGSAEMGLVNVLSQSPETMQDDMQVDTREINDQTNRDVVQHTEVAAAQSAEYVSFDGVSFYQHNQLNQFAGSGKSSGSGGSKPKE